YAEPKEIFLTEDGRPIKREYVSKLFSDAAKAAGISGATYHCLRHTFAIAMFKQLSRQPDLNPWKALQVLLGHAQLSTTLDIYLEALEIDEAAVSDSVEKLYEQALEV
ncbi:MAG: tyrosine-type recombinase/integrase, partial [Acidobacteriota bacterium]|nr:tyrosine-type recombinase/integrase [Acidobacteriota bacterium]